MSIDHAELHKTARGRVLLTLHDLKWHANHELSKKSVGGIRYSARLLELKRLGYDIEDRDIEGAKAGKEYRLRSRVPGEGQAKRVKVFLEESDVDTLLKRGTLTPRARKALADALGSFRTNKDKL